MFKLLTKSHANPKTAKSRKKGYLTFILHLSPANLSGFEVCKWRTRGCSAACLNTAGRGGVFKTGYTTNSIQDCRKRRTQWLFNEPRSFERALCEDIERAVRYAAKRGYTAVVRLNGTSDILWEYRPIVYRLSDYATIEHPNIFRVFPDVPFYDYTKAPYDKRAHDIPNYHLTYSLAETKANHERAKEWLKHGHNVSVVFNTRSVEDFPKHFLGRKVISGEESDLRFLDEPGCIVGLTAKGRARKDTTGFVIQV